MKKLLILIIIFLSFAKISAQGTQTNINVNDAYLVSLNKMTSLEELLRPFRGYVVFIDFMASWCQPCITELKSSKRFERYFKRREIIRVYISLDEPQDINKCYLLLSRNNINGYFISQWNSDDPNNTFRKELIKTFFTDAEGNVNIVLPLYVIVDKEGNIVEKNAEKPSTSFVLRDQLEKYM